MLFAVFRRCLSAIAFHAAAHLSIMPLRYSAMRVIDAFAAPPMLHALAPAIPDAGDSQGRRVLPTLPLFADARISPPVVCAACPYVSATPLLVGFRAAHAPNRKNPRGAMPAHARRGKEAHAQAMHHGEPRGSAMMLPPAER